MQQDNSWQPRLAMLTWDEFAAIPASGKVVMVPVGAIEQLRWLISELYCLLSGPEKERARDIWQLRVFGLAGKLDFTGISQRWLREAVKWWAAEDLPLRRGRAAADSARGQGQENPAAARTLAERVARPPDPGDAAQAATPKPACSAE